MSIDQISIVLILVITFMLFLWGRWRYDIVAFVALLITTVVGLIPIADAFDGFSHPATITVAEVLILSRVLKSIGITELITSKINRYAKHTSTHIMSVSLVGAFLSSFMNNVGAIALMIPAAVESSIFAKRSVSLILMPLSFATILGGLVTLIGTPPNIIIASYRQTHFGVSFEMFDFTYVGLPVALGGIVYVSVLGWRFLTKAIRSRKPAEKLFVLDRCLTEVSLNKDSKFIGKTIREIKEELGQDNIIILGVVKENELTVPSSFRRKLQFGDILLIEADPTNFQRFFKEFGFDLIEVKEEFLGLFKANNLDTQEYVLSDDSFLIGCKRDSVHLQRRFGVTLLAISRQGDTFRGRLKDFKFQVGDILFFYGDRDLLDELPGKLGGFPLRGRDISFTPRPRIWLPASIFFVAIVLTTLNIFPIQIAFGFAIVSMVVLGLIPLHDLYKGIDWPVVILLGSLIPIGGAFEDTGLAVLIVNTAFHSFQLANPLLVIFVLMAITMTLTDIMNNTATAVIMAPIAVNLADKVNMNPDALLMTVAVASSCSFLTPIGHKNNALVMGPGGYKFGDYWRMGLPLEVVILLIATPLLYIFWG